MKEVQELVGIVPWTFVAQICNLFLTVFLVKKFLFDRINKVVEERKQMADSQIADATKAKEEAKTMRDQYEASISNAKDEARQIISDAQKSATERGEAIVADARTRGASAQDTIAMWNNVRKGEEKNIFPYQETADVVFNSALIYELAVLKPYAEPLLFGIDRNAPEYSEAKRLLKFFDYFVGIDSQKIPINSILREFIGGSCFNV